MPPGAATCTDMAAPGGDRDWGGGVGGHCWGRASLPLGLRVTGPHIPSQPSPHPPIPASPLPPCFPHCSRQPVPRPSWRAHSWKPSGLLRLSSAPGPSPEDNSQTFPCGINPGGQAAIPQLPPALSSPGQPSAPQGPRIPQPGRPGCVTRTGEIKAMGFPGGSVVKNPSENAGDTDSIPGPGRSHMPQSSKPLYRDY
ncbi:uncharacterized protein LOC129546676 [Moschus berezovskii]|uniref:uncharacterized protein LOC129546676 n=1 Tax=Moschus berezovskii TaxID=68408 RepID=UPI00244437AE|nr:uncharacterized protein LOC129546676 [Moschus berezovskii]